MQPKSRAGKKVAVKILENVADNIEEIEEEFLVLRDLSLHPNIPAFYGLFLRRGTLPEEDQLWFVMESYPGFIHTHTIFTFSTEFLQLCTGGSVTDLVQGLKNRNACLTEEQIAYILHETVQALVHLHNNHCMHRDIKGHNILLTEEAHVKLVDFGVSSHLAATMGRRNTSVGTPYWMAPEVIACEQQLDSSYDARCDVWSLGITAVELAQGDPPLSELHPMRALFQIPRNPPPQLTRPDCPQLADFVAECLMKDLEQRPFAKELLRHPLLRKGAACAQKARNELKVEIQRQRKDGRCHRQAEVTTKHGKLKTERKAQPKKIYFDDLAALDVLSEENIVQQLQHRYEADTIYTYIGDILVAVNPFTRLGLYTPAEQKKYCGQARSLNPPHIFAVADAAHQALIHQRLNQSIVISGESGAGKTESGNLLLKQLVFLGKAPNGNLEERILQMNPLMEAFGNAQTGINANSSRFGKFLELSLTRSGRVTGARVSVYLLEQSRVVQRSQSERNFHIFYYLYDGIYNDNRMKEFHLDPDLRLQHSVLTNDKQDAMTRKNNIEKFEQIKSAFKVIGFQAEETNSIYKVLAAILHLGDLEFGEVISDDNTDNKSRIIDLAPLHRASNLLGIEAGDLSDSLTANTVVTRGETITRNNSVIEACATRDALAKALYSRLFDWLVNSINSLLTFNSRDEPLVIGLLDIFGFENFARNSFEQLCINIANEQIQFYFNQHIFTWEQQEYIAEGIPVDLVEFTDNRPVLDMLLSRPIGLLALLDEESRFPRSTDRSLIDKFHGNIKSKLYIQPKSNALCFGVYHFAGRVIYQAEGFLDKNRHFLAPELIQLLRGSHIETVRFLFQCPITKTGNLYSPNSTPIIPLNSSPNCDSVMGLASQSRAQQTAATYFRYSLMELLQKMVAGAPQFVRCIKPNDNRQAKLFDSVKIRKIVLVQSCVRRWLARTKYKRLRKEMSSSVLTLQRYVRGWITRKKIKKETMKRNQNNRNACSEQLKEINQNQQQLQRQKAKKAKLPKESQKENSAAVIIQSHFRGYTIRKQWGQQQQAKKQKRAPPPPEKISPHKQKAHPPLKQKSDQQSELISLSQNVHLLNQEAHKFMRRNKAGIRVMDVKDMPQVYMQHIIYVPFFHSSPLTLHSIHLPLFGLNVLFFRTLRFDNSLSSDDDSDNDLSIWDLPLIQYENQLHPLRNKMITLDMEVERRNLLAQNKRHAVIWSSPIKNPNVDERSCGPYDFRKLLRPTEHPPTESLRRRLDARTRLQNLKAM
ncbi:unnamed protein product [Bemisia tabaci]|uniref:non-specific serine/threonine protein kinase n=1 Tax=Bemisia tabaci TaxID=7038 RepID=A0A9P0F549_BEMTA|nr:unnamed protein product [Bemisia tabaci]